MAKHSAPTALPRPCSYGDVGGQCNKPIQQKATGKVAQACAHTSTRPYYRTPTATQGPESPEGPWTEAESSPGTEAERAAADSDMYALAAEEARLLARFWQDVASEAGATLSTCVLIASNMGYELEVALGKAPEAP